MLQQCVAAVCCSVLQCVAVCCSDLCIVLRRCRVVTALSLPHDTQQDNTLHHTATPCNTLQYTATRCNTPVVTALSLTGCRRRIGCLIFRGHFPQKSLIISGSSAKIDLQLKASYGSSPPCAHDEVSDKITQSIYIYIYIIWGLAELLYLDGLVLFWILASLWMRVRMYMFVRVCERVWVCVGACMRVDVCICICVCMRLLYVFM